MDMTTISLFSMAGAVLAAGIWALWERQCARILRDNLSRAYDDLAQAREDAKTAADRAEQLETRLDANAAAFEEARRKLEDTLRMRETHIEGLLEANADLQADLRALREETQTQKDKLTEIRNLFQYSGSEAGQEALDAEA